MTFFGVSIKTTDTHTATANSFLKCFCWFSWLTPVEALIFCYVSTASIYAYCGILIIIAIRWWCVDVGVELCRFAYDYAMIRRRWRLLVYVWGPIVWMRLCIPFSSKIYFWPLLRSHSIYTQMIGSGSISLVTQLWAKEIEISMYKYRLNSSFV